jgi:hypothetical protein
VTEFPPPGQKNNTHTAENQATSAGSTPLFTHSGKSGLWSLLTKARLILEPKPAPYGVTMM